MWSSKTVYELLVDARTNTKDQAKLKASGNNDVQLFLSNVEITMQRDIITKKYLPFFSIRRSLITVWDLLNNNTLSQKGFTYPFLFAFRDI